MGEIWKPIKGYEGLYEVSNYTRVRSLKTGKQMAQQIGYDGYVRVALTKGGRQRSLFLHRLVAIAFLPNAKSFPEVNHKDEDKQNNFPENLEWCTHKYNANFGTRLRRMAISNYEPVIQYSKDGKEIARYASQKEAKERTGIKGNHICSCCKGKRKTAGGYVWKYANKHINQPQNSLFLPQK